MAIDTAEQIKPPKLETEKEEKLSVLGNDDYEKLLSETSETKRKRKALLINENWEHATKMVSALLPDSYIRPHKHGNVHQTETFNLLKGEIVVVTFDEDGIEDKRITLKENELARILVNRYHTLYAVEPSVVYVVKGQPSGGYDEELDKVLASWVPEELTEQGSEYLEKLKNI